MAFALGLQSSRGRHQGKASGGDRSCISVTSRLIILKFSGNATFYIYLISQKIYVFEKVL
jgi:hypothetical protein